MTAQEACLTLVPFMGIQALSYKSEAIAGRSRIITTHVVRDQQGKPIGRGRAEAEAWEDAHAYLKFLHAAGRRR